MAVLRVRESIILMSCHDIPVAVPAWRDGGKSGEEITRLQHLTPGDYSR